MDFNAFKEWAFLGMLSGGVIILWQMKNEMSELNTKIALIIQRTDNHEKRIEKLEEKQP